MSFSSSPKVLNDLVTVREVSRISGYSQQYIRRLLRKEIIDVKKKWEYVVNKTFAIPDFSSRCRENFRSKIWCQTIENITYCFIDSVSIAFIEYNFLKNHTKPKILCIN